MHAASLRPAQAPPPGSHCPVDDEPLESPEDEPPEEDDESEPLLPSEPSEVVEPDVGSPDESEPPEAETVSDPVVSSGGPDVELGSALVVDEPPSSVAGVASSPHPAKNTTIATHRARPMPGCCPPSARSVDRAGPAARAGTIAEPREPPVMTSKTLPPTLLYRGAQGLLVVAALGCSWLDDGGETGADASTGDPTGAATGSETSSGSTASTGGTSPGVCDPPCGDGEVCEDGTCVPDVPISAYGPCDASCEAPEFPVQLKGVEGCFCSPLCDAMSCPDAAEGTATPSCALDAAGAGEPTHCALLCDPKMPEQCPPGASCVETGVPDATVCMQSVIQHMLARGGGGSIINTTSVSGMFGNFGQSNYAAAKAGIYGLTRTAAIELKKHNIRVNAIAPIAFTEMTEQLPMMRTDENARERFSPTHVSPVVAFLASDLAQDTTGLIVAVEGAALSLFRMIQTPALNPPDAQWTPQTIADAWKQLTSS